MAIADLELNDVCEQFQVFLPACSPLCLSIVNILLWHTCLSIFVNTFSSLCSCLFQIILYHFQNFPSFYSIHSLSFWRELCYTNQTLVDISRARLLASSSAVFCLTVSFCSFYSLFLILRSPFARPTPQFLTIHPKVFWKLYYEC